MSRLYGNPLGDEGLAALVAPPPPAGAPPPTTGGLAQLKWLDLSCTQITDAGCATLAAALDSGALPALEQLFWTASLPAPRRRPPYARQQNREPPSSGDLGTITIVRCLALHRVVPSPDKVLSAWMGSRRKCETCLTSVLHKFMYIYQ